MDSTELLSDHSLHRQFACLSLAQTSPLHFGLITAATAQCSRQANVIDMPLHAPPSLFDILHVFKALTTVARVRDTDPIKRTACIVPSRLSTAHATWRYRKQGQTAQQCHHPTIIFSAADQVHLTVLPDLRVPHEWQIVGDATAMPRYVLR
jgi:hypothetical protein